MVVWFRNRSITITVCKYLMPNMYIIRDSSNKALHYSYSSLICVDVSARSVKVKVNNGQERIFAIRPLGQISDQVIFRIQK